MDIKDIYVEHNTPTRVTSLKKHFKISELLINDSSEDTITSLFWDDELFM